MPALGTFFPGVAGWNELIPDGAAHTVSADGLTATITDPVRTRSYDVGTTLARVQWDGTATGTIKGRTSASRIRQAQDRALILPGSSEWDASEFYDPGLGSLPGAVGWTDGVSGESIGGGYLNVPTSGNQLFSRYADGLFVGGKLTIINFRMSYESGTGDQGVHAILPLGTGVYTGQTTFYFSLTNAGALLNGGTQFYVIPNFAASTFYDFALVFRTNDPGTRPPYYEVWLRAAGSYDFDDLTGYEMVAQVVTSAANDWTRIWFGGVWSGGTTCKWGKIRLFVSPSGIDEYGFETVTDGDTSFARNQRHWQFKGWVSGTLTELDIASDLSAPSATGAPTANEISDTALGSAWSAVAGAAAYLVNTVNTGTSTIVDSQWVTGTVSATDGLSAGTYRHDVYAASDDGVRSATAGESNTVTLPATTATAPTIGPYPRWVSGELRFYKPTAGSSSLTGGTYAVLSASQAAGAYSVADSTSWASITWRATDGTGQYVTADDLGLSVSATTWYRDRITDSGNLVAEGQTAVYGGDEDTALCVVSFSGLTAGTTVACKLSAPCEVNGAVYPVYQTSYTTTVANDGTASLTLPRCDAGDNQDGSGTVYGIFTGGSPQAFVLYRRIPDSATATFASLIAP